MKRISSSCGSSLFGASTAYVERWIPKSTWAGEFLFRRYSPASMIEYPPGTPCWLDLNSPDMDASRAFYGELFGWSSELTPGPVDEVGGHRMFRLDGAAVGGLGPAMAGAPAAWTTYVAVENAASTRKRVEQAGGSTIMEPFPITDAGTMALFKDGADGAIFAVWQPGEHHGAELVNAVGALTMNELGTRDLEGAGRFYGAVFGWDLVPIEVEGNVVYGSFQLG